MRNIILRIYYPRYYGKRSSRYSYKSYFIGGDVRPGTADQLIGRCSDHNPSGWVRGVRGAFAARSRQALSKLIDFYLFSN